MRHSERSVGYCKYHTRYLEVVHYQSILRLLSNQLSSRFDDYDDVRKRLSDLSKPCQLVQGPFNNILDRS